MENAKCRSRGYAADAGAYGGSCVADIMGKSLNPSYGGWRKSLPRTEQPRPSDHHRLFQ